ncbi:UNVERIFIED_CONTAM: hypothetical protein FKN15_058942, partial [Acipenser sinensis]
GFGSPSGEHWLGNEFVFLLTSQRQYSLRIELTDWDGTQAFSQYDRFYIGNEKHNYRAKRTRAARLGYIWWQRDSALQTTVLKNDGHCRAYQDFGKVHGGDAGGNPKAEREQPAVEARVGVAQMGTGVPRVRAGASATEAGVAGTPARVACTRARVTNSGTGAACSGEKAGSTGAAAVGGRGAAAVRARGGGAARAAELQLSEEEELPPSESEGEELPELQLYEEEELKCPAPPQPRPPPQQSSPALVGTVPCPVLVDTLPECMDLPVLDLVPRSGHHQAQLLTWSLAPLPLKPQTSRRGRVTSLAFPLPPAVFPLESQRLLHRSRSSHLCLSLHRPGYRPTRRSPLASRLGPSSPVRGPYPNAPEESTHPQAHPKDREKMGLCGLEGWWFDACGPSNLNGMYYKSGQNLGKLNGIKWHYFKGPSYSLRATAMMIRPLDF